MTLADETVEIDGYGTFVGKLGALGYEVTLCRIPGPDPTEPAGQLAKLADEAGTSLIEMAIAFVLRHPAIASAMIGPRAMEHLESQFPAVGIDLPDDVLDRIDQIAAPGVSINPGDNGWVSPALQPAARRR